MTSDYKIILSHLDGLKPDLIPVPGSNLEAALQLADSICAVTDAPARFILFTDDFTNETFSLLQNLVTNSNKNIDIMPMNTIAGADIFKPGGKTPFKDKNGQTVHSSLNKEILNKLKSLKNMNLNALTLDDSDVQLIARSVSDHLRFQEEDQEKEDDWEDRGIWFAIPLALLALFWFRKGWVIFLFFITLSITSCSDNIAFKDLWFTRDYQAQQHFDRGNFTQAAGLFADPMRKGIAYYKAGNYDKAIEAFEQDTTAEGAYNLGLAYYKNGDYAEAAIAFGKAVELNPDMGDAQTNRELMQQYISGMDESSTGDAKEAQNMDPAKNVENKDMEDLSGGGQEATKEDMEKERKEETVETGKRKGKELEDVPDDFKSGESKSMENIVMQIVDDDPSLFLKRKFRYQLKKGMVSKPKNSEIEW